MRVGGRGNVGHDALERRHGGCRGRDGVVSGADGYGSQVGGAAAGVGRDGGTAAARSARAERTRQRVTRRVTLHRTRQP